MRLFGRFHFSVSLLALLFVVQERATAQPDSFGDPCLGGTLYYIAFPDTTANAQDSRVPDDEPQEFVLMLYSAVDQQITISRAGGAGLAVQLEAGIMLEWDTRQVRVPIVTSSNVKDRGSALKVEAQSPIIVYAHMTSKFGSSGFTPLPVEAWGTEYHAVTWPGEVIRNVYPAGEANYNASEKKSAPATILIIAASDNTQIAIRPEGALAECNGCERVVLDEGDVYQVHSYVDTTKSSGQPDLTGTQIVANKRFAVISGNTRTPIDSIDFPMLSTNSPKDQTAEWLLPDDMLGTEFAYTPTEDKLQKKGTADGVHRTAENIRLVASSDATLVRVKEGGDASNPEAPLAKAIGAGEFFNVRFEKLLWGRLVTTTGPAQAMHAVNSAAEFNGTTGSGNFIGASFKSWGSAMVTMVSRDRWGSFAPFRAPTHLSSMSNYVVVVTDSAHRSDIYLQSFDTAESEVRVDFAHAIYRSDLIWTTLAITPGKTYRLVGRNGARFTGHLYGLYEDGFEIYTPGGTREKGTSSASFHPAEYEENVGQAYAMPLAFPTCLSVAPDEYEVEVTQDCEDMLIKIRALNDNPAGIKFVRLRADPDSTFNVRIEPVDPATLASLADRAISDVTVRVTAFNSLRDARGVVEFRDRTRDGKIFSVRYRYDADRVILDPNDTLDFGEVTLNQSAGERVVTITNPSDGDIVVRELGFQAGDRNFEILRTEPSFRWSDPLDSLVLKRGDSLRVILDITPTEASRIYEDRLFVQVGCVRPYLLLRAVTVEPCIYVRDLDFGILGVGQEKTIVLEICNVGDGSVSFTDSAANGEVDYLSWIEDNFEVSRDDIDLIGRTVLRGGECVKIDVTFSSQVEGTFRTVARFWASTRECRDTSIWTARVGTLSVDEEEGVASGLVITSITPNPAGNFVRVGHNARHGRPLEVTILDASGHEHVSVTEVDAVGESVLDTSALPSGLYFVRIRDGENEAVESVTIVR